LRDRAAQHHACAEREPRQRQVEDLAADVVEVDVHALRTAARQRFADVLIFVVDSGVEVRFLREPLAFLGATRDSDDAGSFYLRDHARAGCACGA
jgi:hypothetical protein